MLRFLLIAFAALIVGRSAAAGEGGDTLQKPAATPANDRTKSEGRASGNWAPCDGASLRRIRKKAAECFDLKFELIFDERATDRDELQVAFCLTDAEQLAAERSETANSHYCARIRRSEIALAKVQGGAAAIIGQRFALKRKLNDGRPHTVLIKRRREKIAIFLDDSIAVRGRDEGLSRGDIAIGRVGVFVKVRDLKYQKVGDVFFSDDFMREGGPGTNWTKVSGRWALSHVRNVNRSSNPFRCVGRGKGDALLVAGHAFWDDYTVQASAKCDDDGAFGIVFYYENPRKYFLFRWRGAESRAVAPLSSGRLEILKVDEGDGKDAEPGLKGRRESGSRLIAERQATFKPGQWYRLAVKVSGQRAEAFIDGIKVFEFEDPGLCAGKIGLYAGHTKGAYFDDVIVQSNTHLGPKREPIKLFSRVFEKRDQMENWASIWSSWRPRSDAIGARAGRGMTTIYWHRGDFFGDVSIGVPFNAIRPRKRHGKKGAALNTELNLLVGGNGRSVRRGYRLRVRGVRDGGVLALQLCRDRRVIAEKEVPFDAAASDGRVSLARRNGAIVCMLGGAAILSKRIPEEGATFNSTKIALWSNSDVELRKVEIYSDDVYDYLFETAPVDWELQLGEWKVTNRWTCDPSWSWMGGASSQLAVIWSKREFHGDMTVEFFAAFQMAKGEGYPSDINLTICGDGKNLNSGYSFIYAGWGNKWTRILKRDRIIAESDRFTISNSGLSDLFELHRNWFHIKARKIGARIQLYVNGVLVREVIDPDPLDGGKVAIWTFGKGILISRARIYCADARQTSLLTREASVAHDFSQRTSVVGKKNAGGAKNEKAADAATTNAIGRYGRPADSLVFNDFEKDMRGWRNPSGKHGASLSLDDATAAGGKRSLRLTNTHCGGDFGAVVSVPDYDLHEFPLVMFDYRIGPDAKVNLYAKVEGKYYSVSFTGPQTGGGDSYAELFGPAVSVGKIESVKADGQWHHAAFDLLAALEEHGVEVNQKRLTVEEIALGNLSNKDYLLCGFNGNPAGATYHVDNFGICGRRETKR